MSQTRSLIHLFLGFILSATGVHTCPIELNPPKAVVKYGDPILISCSTSDSLVVEMGWEASRGGISQQPVKHLNWTLESLTDWTIAPLCFINLSPASSIDQCHKRPEIVLYTFPENISISSSSHSKGFKENEEHQFSCDLGDIAPVQNLTVRWYKRDVMIHTDTLNSLSRRPLKWSPIFSYRVTRQDNGATFRCEAHMDLGPEGPQLYASSQEYNITVYFGPELKCSDIEFVEGETIESKCSVKGNPAPFVQWLKDGQLTNLSVPLSRENSGLYNIEAEGNSRINTTITIFVLYEPELACPSNYTGLEFAPHNITCTVTGYPKPNIAWFREGEEVGLPEALTRDDAGQYVITASNKVSSVSSTLDITVTYPPSQIAELEDSEVEVGSDVSLKCSSMGNPRPKYVWSYYLMANVKEQSEDGVSRLLIHNATAYNMGSYTCHASNKNGNVSKTATLIIKGAKKECPIEITPNRMVIQYQGQTLKAECVVTSNYTSNVKEVYWKAQPNITVLSSNWSISTWDWDSRPYCVATFIGIGKCQKPLDYTLYKTPDSVFISSDLSSVVEGRHFQLECGIIGVAPARSLAVRWFQGNDTFEPDIRGSQKVSGCPYEITHCNISVIRSPVNVTYTIGVTLNRTHTSVQFQCEVALNLGPEGPQPPPVRSSPLTITVLSKPVINTENLPKTVPVFRGYPERLVCEADGHPPPKIQWSNRSNTVLNSTLTVTEAGLYNCTATNEVGSSFYVVEVILKEDYLPLIAGFVAVTVVAISVIFLFIYSIYYKNTKMRRYSLKNPKLSNHNGNVAHNGWDMQFPMTNLS